MRADPASQVVARHTAGHDDIAEHEVDVLAAFDNAHCGGPALGLDRDVAEPLDALQSQFADFGVVLDDEDDLIVLRQRQSLRLVRAVASAPTSARGR